jgi:hypothetical protein
MIGVENRRGRIQMALCKEASKQLRRKKICRSMRGRFPVRSAPGACRRYVRFRLKNAKRIDAGMQRHSHCVGSRRVLRMTGRRGQERRSHKLSRQIATLH